MPSANYDRVREPTRADYDRVREPTRAKGGAISRIVPELKPGAGVVTTRGHVHYVATEYGVVNLHGLNLRERAEARIGIAHPDVRGELRLAASRIRHVRF